MTMSPRNRGPRPELRGPMCEVRGAAPLRGAMPSSFGKLRTSVAVFLRRDCLLSAWMRASDTNAMAASPSAARGATRASQAARPGARTDRPRPLVMTTRRRGAIRGGLSGSATVGFVRLHDLLHERVAHDVL